MTDYVTIGSARAALGVAVCSSCYAGGSRVARVAAAAAVRALHALGDGDAHESAGVILYTPRPPAGGSWPTPPGGSSSCAAPSAQELLQLIASAHELHNLADADGVELAPGADDLGHLRRIQLQLMREARRGADRGRAPRGGADWK